MFKNNLKIAWRSLLKNRFFTLLNISGLAVSLVVAIFLLTYAQQELSFNSSFPKSQDIFRVNMVTSQAYNFEKWVQLPNAVGPAMEDNIPEVQKAARWVRYNFGGTSSLRWENENYLIKDFYLTDAAFFEIFDFEFLEGNGKLVFEKPNSVVISESERQRIFGDKTALNQEITIDGHEHLTVTGVFRDLPQNTSFDGKIYANIMDSWMGKNVYWSNASYETFCLLQPDAEVNKVEDEATALIDKHVAKKDQYFTQFLLQPLSKIYLYSHDLEHSYSSRTGNINQVRLFFLLSFLILAIAAINYINLTTARAQHNAKEVGVSKVLGASRQQIRKRFYTETAILVLVAILGAILLCILTLPLFNGLTDNEFTIAQLLTAQNLLIFLGLWLLISFLGGSYPSLVMAKMPTLGLMKHQAGKNNLSEGVRKTLVIFQFSCSIVLIIGVLIMKHQMEYVSSKDLGYQPKKVLSIPINGVSSWNQLEGLEQDLRNLAGTKSVSAMQTYPGKGESGKTIYRPGEEGAGLPIQTSSSLDPVVNTLGLHLIAGEDLPRNLAKGDSTAYLLINEVVSTYLGYSDPKDAIGQYADLDGIKNAEIKGVVRNFNFGNLKENVRAYTFYKAQNPSEGYYYLLANFGKQQASSYLGQVRDIFEKRVPNAAFDYLFLEDYLKDQYRTENRSESVLTVFSLLAIFIACLGLFGLAAFTAEQRKKEIGVRKVLGASILEIIKLLSSQFSRLIFLALLIAVPLGWWIFSEWLNGFAYRIQISWQVFLFAAFLVMVIAAVPIGFQSIKAARSNPVDSLRDE